MRNHPQGAMTYRLGDFVDAATVELLADETAGPGHGAVQDVLVVRASRAVGLVLLAVHDVEVDVALVDEVGPVGVTEVIEGGVIHELTDALHGDTGQADVRHALGEASLGERALGGDLQVELLKEARAAEDQGGLATKAGQLADLLAEVLADLLGARDVGDLVRTDSRAVAPEGVGRAVDATHRAGRRSVGDEGQEAGDFLRVSNAVAPEHGVERLGPALVHVLELLVEQAGQDGDVAIGVLGGGLAGRAVNDGQAVVLQLGEGERDTSVDFLPGEGGALGVRGVGVGDGIVVREASDSRGVVEDDRHRDVTLATGESLLLLGESLEKGLVLDGLGERATLDVVVEGGGGDVSEFSDREGHDDVFSLGGGC